MRPDGDHVEGPEPSGGLIDGERLEEQRGRRVRAQVDGWKESRRWEQGSPLLEQVPLHVTGTLMSRESPRVGTIWSVAGSDVVPVTVRVEPPPLEPSWDELPEAGDTTWRGRLRRRQSWYREMVLGLEPGVGGRPPRPVASMLPVAAVRDDPTLNFLVDGRLEGLARERLSRSDWGGIVEPHRLYHNLLSSQPLCFNLFGHLALEGEALVTVLNDVFGVAATGVRDVRLEWAPERGEHLGGGSAFDCFIEYDAAGGVGFVGVETKYAENLADQRPSTRPAYRAATEAPDSGFRPGASDRLARPTACQLWYNTLLAASLRRARGYIEGVVAIVACADDLAARAAVEDVRTELNDPDAVLRHATIEALVAAAGDSPWGEHFRLRYLTDPSPG